MKRRRHRERGVALVCALMLMLAATMIGVAVARNAFAALAAARAERDRDVARAAAEAALRDAERDIAGSATASAARAARFDAVDAFVDGCGRGGADLGLCRATSPPAWQDVDLAEADSDVLVPYGHYTGAVLATGHGLLPVRLPAYLIERLEPGAAAAAQGSVYRISAIGFGMRASTQVVLQSLYRKAAPAGSDGATGPSDSAAGPGSGGQGDAPVHDGAAPGGAGPAGPGTQDPGGEAQPPPHPLPAGRIGWREIANWSELHARVHH